jgi:hypothetical protein
MKHLIAIILVVSIATIVVEGRHNRHSGGWGRHQHECKASCFAHCLAGTTADVNDFCNLTGLTLFSVKLLFLVTNHIFSLNYVCYWCWPMTFKIWQVLILTYFFWSSCCFLLLTIILIIYFIGVGLRSWSADKLHLIQSSTIYRTISHSTVLDYC